MKNHTKYFKAAGLLLVIAMLLSLLTACGSAPSVMPTEPSQTPAETPGSAETPAKTTDPAVRPTASEDPAPVRWAEKMSIRKTESVVCVS